MTTTINHRFLLNKRPIGPPRLTDFRLDEQSVTEPGKGQILLRTIYLSLDPYMRGRMSEGPSYAPPVDIDAVMVGGTVSRVEVSHHSNYKVGDLVLANAGWQEYALSDGSDLIRLDKQISHPSYALSLLGMPGFTAYHGLLNIGEPKAGETVVVASATGAVGSVVGQVAKIKGAHVVGIAGGADKCRYAVETLGFDACVDHHASDFADQLAVATSNGIDIYFESVGGTVFEAVLPRLNVHARIPVCGMIAHYNDTTPPSGPNLVPHLMMHILAKRWRVQGFIISDHWAEGFAPFLADMSEWIAQGKVKLREDITEGLQSAPQAFLDLLVGKNFGKSVVHVSNI